MSSVPGLGCTREGPFSCRFNAFTVSAVMKWSVLWPERAPTKLRGPG